MGEVKRRCRMWFVGAHDNPSRFFVYYSQKTARDNFSKDRILSITGVKGLMRRSLDDGWGVSFFVRRAKWGKKYYDSSETVLRSGEMSDVSFDSSCDVDRILDELSRMGPGPKPKLKPGTTPFLNKTGNQAIHADVWSTNVRWLELGDFDDTIEFVGMDHSCGLFSTKHGRCNVLPNEMKDIIPRLTRGKLSGRFGFVRVGGHHGIRYIGKRISRGNGIRKKRPKVLEW